MEPIQYLFLSFQFAIFTNFLSHHRKTQSINYYHEVSLSTLAQKEVSSGVGMSLRWPKGVSEEIQVPKLASEQQPIEVFIMSHCLHLPSIIKLFWNLILLQMMSTFHHMFLVVTMAIPTVISLRRNWLLLALCGNYIGRMNLQLFLSTALSLSQALLVLRCHQQVPQLLLFSSHQAETVSWTELGSSTSGD
jgi:hypothetical protein